MFTFKTLAFAAVAGGASLAAAQSISSQCQSTLAALALSSEAACLNPTGLISFATLGSNASVIAPVNSWLSGMCSKAPCTNDTIASVITNVTSGCSSDLSSLNLSSSDTSEIITAAQSAYPAARQIACLEDTSAGNELCVTETLYAIQNSTGTLSTANIESLASQVMAGALPSFVSNSTITCTNCTKAALNIIYADFPGLLDASANSTVEGQCGSSFLDGQAPASVSQSANSATAGAATNGAGALALSFGAMALSSVAAAFAVLA